MRKLFNSFMTRYKTYIDVKEELIKQGHRGALAVKGETELMKTLSLIEYLRVSGRPVRIFKDRERDLTVLWDGRAFIVGGPTINYKDYFRYRGIKPLYRFNTIEALVGFMKI